MLCDAFVQSTLNQTPEKIRIVLSNEEFEGSIKIALWELENERIRWYDEINAQWRWIWPNMHKALKRLGCKSVVYFSMEAVP